MQILYVASLTILSESIVKNMMKCAYEMQDNDRRPKAWSSSVAGHAATGDKGHVRVRTIGDRPPFQME
jgi:hypothetical protein